MALDLLNNIIENWQPKKPMCNCIVCKTKKLTKCVCKKCKGCKIHLGDGHKEDEYKNGYCKDCYKRRFKN